MAAMRTYPASAYQTLFDAAGKSLSGAVDERRAALGQVTARGIPSRRVENWKYTDLRRLAQQALPLGAPVDAAPDLSRLVLGNVNACKLVFVNGHYAPDLSDPLPEGLSFTPLALALAEGRDDLIDLTGPDVPGQLNTAFMQDGAVLDIAPDADIAQPIHLIFTGEGDPAATYSRNLICAGRSSRATVLESHLMATGWTSNCVTALDIAANAALIHIKVHQGAAESLHLGRVDATMARDTRLDSGLYNFGGGLARTDSHIVLSQPGSEAQLTGAYLLEGKDHNDNTVVVEHQAPHCRSHQLFKGVLDGTSRGVFQGKVIVAEGASDTDGRQRCQALLLSERAEQDIKPELEIYNDDVQCAHGATIGQLDEEAVFYLRSRGVPLAEARALLIRAFLAETVDNIGHDGVRAALEAAIDGWLDTRGEGA